MDIKVNKETVICFDLDDTIYNELDYLKSAYLEIALFLQKDNALLLYGKMLSAYRNGDNVFNYLMDTYNCDRDKLLQLYREHQPNIKPFDGIYKIFEAIKEKEGKLCLITDGRPVTQRNKLKALKIDTLFDKIVISGEIGTEKPDENNYTIIEETFLDCNYTYIADNFKKDFLTPNKRNWNSIGLLDNGKNIHNNTFSFSDTQYRPKELITAITQINII